MYWWFFISVLNHHAPNWRKFKNSIYIIKDWSMMKYILLTALKECSININAHFTNISFPQLLSQMTTNGAAFLQSHSLIIRTSQLGSDGSLLLCHKALAGPHTSPEVFKMSPHSSLSRLLTVFSSWVIAHSHPVPCWLSAGLVLRVWGLLTLPRASLLPG